MSATDWDGEAFCCVDGCHEPATHSNLTGMVYDLPLYELACEAHAAVPA